MEKKEFIDSERKLLSLLPKSTKPKGVREMVVPYQILGFIKRLRLLDEFQTLKVDEDLTAVEVKVLRNKAVHALFTIAQRVEREIHRSA